MNQTTEKNREYGSFALRFLAWVFDVLLIWSLPPLALLIVMATVPTTAGFWTGLLWVFWLIVFGQWFVMLGYRVATLVYFQASFGKILAGLEIQKEDGSKLDVRDGVLRFVVGYMVSVLLWGLGYFWIVKDSKRRGFHDQIAGTVVVKKASARQIFIVLPIMMVIYVFIWYAIIKVGVDRGLWRGVATDTWVFWQHAGEVFRETK